VLTCGHKWLCGACTHDGESQGGQSLVAASYKRPLAAGHEEMHLICLVADGPIEVDSNSKNNPNCDDPFF
jgi:hypothetical protein